MRLFGSKKNVPNENDKKPVGNEESNRFKNLMNFAEAVLKNSNSNTKPHPILDVIRLYARQIQAKYLLNVVVSEKRLPDIDAGLLFFDWTEEIAPGKKMYELIEETSWNGKLSLGRDVVLPWPWEYHRLYRAICNIREYGKWVQDDNHRIELWLPIGVAWTIGGNHSISTGIIQGNGEITPRRVCDMSKLYEYVETDGKHYKRKEDGSEISEVKNVEFAAIFEIGRMMVQRGINF